MKRNRLGAAVVAGSMAAGTVLAAGVAIAPAASAAEDAIVINEVESSGAAEVLGGTDWIELLNVSDQPLDVSGFVIKDDNDGRTDSLPPDTIIAAGGFLVLIEGEHFDFGLGGTDAARLFAADGETLIASHAWTGHASVTYGRCPDGTGPFVDTASPTPGEVNDCSGAGEEPDIEPDELSTDLTINEVESNGDDTDWFEVMNLSDAPIDISGYGVKDDNDARPDVIPAGTIIEAGGIYVVDQQTATYPDGFDFGLGDSDMVRLFDVDGELVAKYSWFSHAPVTYARCPDGTGPWVATAVSTKGAPNDCSLPVRINEVESSGDDAVLGGADWVELINIGSDPVDVSGLVLKDDNDGRTDTIPAGSTIAPGGLLLLVEDEHFTFGLGGDDAVRLFAADGHTLIDSYSWTSHAATSYGRCPNGSGPFETTASVTPGELNDCIGLVGAQPWPGGGDVTVLDDEHWFSGDMSGIDYEPASDGQPGTLWAVENGNGLLYKLTADAPGTWSLASGWEHGRVLRFPDGTGTVDAEGVTVVEGEPGVVYVSSERNNDSGSVSRPSVLRYDVTGDGELVADVEWNLSADFPGLGANAGLEGITWVPHSVLTGGGLIDDSTGAAYDPEVYEGHGNGAFVVGVEGTGEAYIYVLHQSQGDTWTRVSTIETAPVGFSMVADVQWDAEREQLWVVCDDACDGRIATYALVDGSFTATGLYERPADMGNFANEGFAIGDASLCVDGAVPTFYVDDSDTDGFSLRSGTLPSECDESDPGDEGEDEPGEGDGSAPGTGDGPGDHADPTDPTPHPAPTPGDTCRVLAPASALAGDVITITLDVDCAPALVHLWLFSEPTDLGTAALAGDGTVTVTIPADTPAGTHTLEVRSLDGAVIGSTTIAIATAENTTLPVTGADGFAGLALAAALIASAGGALLVVRRAVN